MAHGVRLKDEATGAVISFLRNENTEARAYTLQNKDGAIAHIKDDFDALADTPSDTTGHWLSNATPATALAPVQISPSFTRSGTGWKTSGTAASQTVFVTDYVRPTQGSFNAEGEWVVRSNVNDTGYRDILSVNVNTGKMISSGTVDSDQPTFHEFVRYTGGSVIGKGSVGFLGSTEMNISNNMDYTLGSHRYYDATKNATWLYLGNSGNNALGIQWTKAGHPNDATMWSTYGKVIWNVDVIPHTSTGEAVTGGTAMTLQRINMIDSNYSSPNGVWNLTSTAMILTGALSATLPKVAVAVGAIGSTECLNVRQSGANTFTITSNTDNNNNYSQIRFLKSKSGSFNLGVGVKVFENDIQGGVGFNGARATATVISNFSNVEFYWRTTNAAGTLADRMVLSEEGALIVGGVTPSAVAILQADSTTKGFLPPRMTTTQRDAISATAGLLIYNTTTSKLNVFTTAWEVVTSA